MNWRMRQAWTVGTTECQIASCYEGMRDLNLTILIKHSKYYCISVPLHYEFCFYIHNHAELSKAANNTAESGKYCIQCVVC